MALQENSHPSSARPESDVSIWDMSGVTDMRAMFMNTRKFDRSLNAWDTSNVRKMTYMFNGASGMTHDMSPWDVSKVEDARGMFYDSSIIDIELCWSFPSSDDDYILYKSHFLINPSADKCFCVAGEYHDGVTCTACANGYISYGKTKFCEACGADSTSNDKHTACVAGSPTPPPTPAPNADDESSDNDETDYQVAILVLASIIVFLLVVALAAAGVFMFRNTAPKEEQIEMADSQKTKSDMKNGMKADMENGQPIAEVAVDAPSKRPTAPKPPKKSTSSFKKDSSVEVYSNVEAI